MVTRRRAFYIGLLVVCVATRLATTIYYIEDTDSLRFALSVADGFDVADLQPHFPGYPVFWAVAKVLFWITGSFAVSFSLIGGVATFAVIVFAARLARRDPLSADGLAITFLLFFNPMIWLMGNRYMPDLMGVAVALGALTLLMSARPAARGLGTTSARPAAEGSGATSAAAGFATGLLAGTRLSYTPLLLPAYLYALRRRPLRLLAGSALGALVWLIPMIIDTGLHGLIGAATRQTEGHFTEFGGTIETDSDLLTRFSRLLEAVWADGFGAWWPGRHALTLIVGAALVAAAIAAVARARAAAKTTRAARAEAAARNARDTQSAQRVHTDSAARAAAAVRNQDQPPETRPPTLGRPSRRTLLITAALTYVTWIFLFQNVIYKSRHVLPLVALLAIPLGLGLAYLIRARFSADRGAAGDAGAPRAPKGVAAVRIAAGVAALALVVVTLVLVTQHREPTAIAQAKVFVEQTGPDVVASIPLVNFYLSAQGVDATFLSVQNQEDRERIARTEGKLLVVGRFPELMPPNPARADTFYHNPYVNRMWPEVEVYVYER